MRRPWQWPSTGGEAEGERLRLRFGMPRPVAWTLARRGFCDDRALEEFLTPRLDRLSDPRDLDDMPRAVERLWRAVDSGETVFVHGDYDVDGITGTAFLTRTLRALGARVVPYVPTREDGYGLGEKGIAAAREVGARVLVTVDTGTRAFDAVERAQSLGLDVVVLDHHQLGDRLPPAYAVVNPLRGGPDGRLHHLAAVGVAAKFVHAMGAARPHAGLREVYRQALQLVALGTIADVVSLTGENRILVAHGLRQLAVSAWPGVKALKAVAGLEDKRLTTTDVAFFLAPRINAAGRMGEAADALALLLADDPGEGFRLAERIEEANRERRRVEAEITAQALDRVRAEGETPAAVVLWSETWSRGLIGVVASRLLDRLHRPIFLVAMDGDSGRGSARSRGGFPLHEALAAGGDLLEEHGGHAEAAGFTIRREHLEAFRARMAGLAQAAALDVEPAALEIDARVTLDEVTVDCVRWLERLSPFGRGNPEPLLAGEGLLVAELPAVVGKRHLRLSLGQGARRFRAIAFNQGDRVRDLEHGQKVDAIFHAAFDAWRGGDRVQLILLDVRAR